MTGPASNTAVTVAGISTLLTFMSHDISPWIFVGGGLAFELGIAARAGAILFKKLDGTQTITTGDVVRPIAACLAMIPVAASASCIVFLAALLSNVGVTVATIAGCFGALLLLGLRGLEGFQWLASTASSIFLKFALGNQKGGGGQP